jgi:hypothetical protein
MGPASWQNRLMEMPETDGVSLDGTTGLDVSADATDASLDSVRAEFEAILQADDTAIGDVWRRTEAGETPDQIRIAHGAQRSGFVWGYLRTARALIDVTFQPPRQSPWVSCERSDGFSRNKT